MRSSGLREAPREARQRVTRRGGRKGLLHSVLTFLDPNLTLTRTQYHAMVGNAENRKPLIYAVSATLCNLQQPLPVARRPKGREQSTRQRARRTLNATVSGNDLTKKHQSGVTVVVSPGT